MAQQDFPYYWPLGFATASEKIPGAAILQRRDGKDEPITLAGNMVWTGSMWVPVSTQNRLPVEATLTGQKGALPVTIEGVGDAGGALPVKEAIMQAFVARRVSALTPTRLDIDPLANRRYVDLSLVEDDATGYVGNPDLTGPENGIPVTKENGWRLYAGPDTPIYGVGGTFVIVEVA